MQLLQLPLGDTGDLLQPPAELAHEERLGLGILERPNHLDSRYNVLRYTSSSIPKESHQTRAIEPLGAGRTTTRPRDPWPSPAVGTEHPPGGIQRAVVTTAAVAGRSSLESRMFGRPCGMWPWRSESTEPARASRYRCLKATKPERSLDGAAHVLPSVRL
jgi:hypothetical protein